MLSKAASYAIQSLAYLATEGGDRDYVPIGEIAERLSMPYHFLKKVLADLAAHGILVSHRSARGGVALARDPKDITLYDVVKHVDGVDVFHECILKLPGCGNQRPCVLHNAWAKERQRMYDLFTRTSLANVAAGVLKDGLRIRE
jgi:Rrf2 family transcriptional regulator, iron-sulfur cluster assembly transcription factor